MELKSLVVVAVLASGWAPGFAADRVGQQPTPAAQQAEQKPQARPAEEKAPTPRPEPRLLVPNQGDRIPGPLYRMDLTIAELEAKTKANARNYTLLARVGEPGAASLRVGSRVPVTGEKGPSYMNVGVNVDINQLTEIDGILAGLISVEVSSLAPLEPAQPLQQLVQGAPVTRTLQLRTPFSVVPGKPTVIGLIDDVNSPRRFQVELTATKQ